MLHFQRNYAVAVGPSDQRTYYRSPGLEVLTPLGVPTCCLLSIVYTLNFSRLRPLFRRREYFFREISFSSPLFRSFRSIPGSSELIKALMANRLRRSHEIRPCLPTLAFPQKIMSINNQYAQQMSFITVRKHTVSHSVPAI